MNKAAQKRHEAKVSALRQRLSAGGALSAETLSKSYGLPQPEVEKIMKGITNGQHW